MAFQLLASSFGGDVSVRKPLVVHVDTHRHRSEWWGAGMVVSLERGADLHKAQLMPLPLTVSCFSRIQIGFTFLILAHPGSPRTKGR